MLETLQFTILEEIDMELKININTCFWFLGFCFIILKVLNLIDWAWALVLAPFWLPPVIFIAVILIAYVLGFILLLFQN